MVDRSVFQAELEKAQKDALKAKQDHDLLVEELKVQKKITLIDQLRSEMDEVKTSADELRGKMDLLASEQDATKEDLTSTKVQLRVMREKADKWSQLNEDPWA
uniref:Kinesin-like protein KIF3A n=2 Tax=Nicotiana TaxID=4085 RepID=A0A1S4BE70_TOBAC|nr:kinesin-like protein KIF3A [Nicotiana tomentosiformis]XP_016487152.1 PREDICTED: kinesin-like protein KIF3A [Nicotiana tabacum]